MTTPPTKAGTVLCRLAEIPDGAGRGFVLGAGLDQLDIMVLRAGQRVFGYVNSCPHVGTPLDWAEDEFMSEDGRNIMCHTHGALFRIEDGFCVDGPCAGDRLAPLVLEIDTDGQVVLLDGVA